jgi:hypothetical protein
MTNSRFLSVPGAFHSEEDEAESFSSDPSEWSPLQLSDYISTISQEPAACKAVEFVTHYKMTGLQLLTLSEDLLRV